MRKIIVKALLIIVLISTVLILSGCTLQIQTTDNSVSASVDGETTERVDSVIDWVKERITRVFKTEDSSTTSTTESIGEGESSIM